MTVIELFAGAGGASHGIQRAGFEGVGIEMDPNACATRQAVGLDTIRADVKSYPRRQLRGKVVGLWSSSPCVDYSVAGRRAGLKGKTGPLIWEALHWAGVLTPEWVACENVPGALSLFKTICGELRRVGYSTWAGILDAASYGVPQHRRRAILLASLSRRAEPPAATHGADYGQRMDGAILKPYVTMAEALGWDEDAWVDEQSATAGALERPATEPAPTVTAAAGSQCMWLWRQPATTVQGTPRIAKAGHHARQWEGSVPVTLPELAVLQGFPADYPFVGNKTSVSRQIGNACPPAFVEAIVRAVAG